MNNAEKLVNLLIKNKYTISFAESCTGGLCASSVVSVSDASKVLNESFVTYSNDSKIKYLNVKKETIDVHGVVSAQVASEMAIGVAKVTNSDIGVGVTGLAGPTGGSEELPVGTVYFGIAFHNKVYTYKQHFKDLDRNQVRLESVKFIFDQIIQLIENPLE